MYVGGAKMTVYDFLKKEGRDFDVYDSEFVICITIGLAEGEDPYAVFIRMLCQSTIFVKKNVIDDSNSKMVWVGA